ncbi:thiamine diphosphokinase [Pelagibacterium halotolerans]|uniref:Thiamine diphosphokinase n=1 Tax=Pelagibacterium halotolerans (strain DSM 22347 / JCM 15775 / CGMCC 1.7692 / B2) TaxID=1082931 RepID=G4R953_PELHB|nr:thiamine diphosphokinase [Pelagibacterium halotolerans]AEQ52433.1 thiamin pyrophosphokinase [Pelagibacterium halotolerans B2]QJR17836.1 thiamine diphosphokinase [Pelagibacterium halotolerans]
MQDGAGENGAPLEFDGPLLIVGGGDVDPDMLAALAERAAGLVGADRGGDILMAAGLVPDAVIGDMDSVADRTRFPGQTTILTLPEQDTTDFEKCLYSTRAPLTLALGMTGGRFDHTLAALHAVARYATDRKIILIDGHDLAMGVAGSVSLRVGAGERVSIYPLGRTQFAGSMGLLYPLDGLEMVQGKTIGTSNRATENVIEIDVAPGEQDPWLLILDNRLLDAIA